MIYSTTAIASGGRDGSAKLADDSLTLTMTTPGTSVPGHNPEQLFAMGYAACFDNALILTAKRLKMALKGCQTQVTVGLDKVAEQYLLDVTIDVSIEGLEPAQSEQLIALAHEVCPYSNALRGNAKVRVKNLEQSA
ncbi:Ohr family peroxiredoxin [Pseudoalteromonas sp. T1lg76]|uniref:Ohr family peroxiredoxin n=1 Tax=Pseudoalteromonas sp. T1lg76 TaxID=2077103 RepID=UPI000CF72C12|nr:Ohr family peroxiredoxin [Pseudoalteromonas sp. T1lg76]